MTSCSYHASKDAVGSCVSCGKLICRACQSEIDSKSYCPVCIEKLFTTSQAVAQPAQAPAAAKPDGQAVNPAWWLLPVFLSWLGGLAAWLVNKEHNASMARYMLFTGIGIAIIQGLVGLIIIVVLLAPSAVTPGQNPSAATALPPVTSPAPPAGTGDIATGPKAPAVSLAPAPLPVNPGQQPPVTNSLPEVTGSVSAATTPTIQPPLISEQQPPDFAVQKAKIDEVISQLCTAFKAKDVEGALKYFQEQERDKYRKIFTQYPDLLPIMASDLEKARISFLAFNSNQYSRIAEYLIRSDGQDFSIVFISLDGQWWLSTF